MSSSSDTLPTSPTSPIAPFPPLPPHHHHSRAPEFYGFAAWTATIILFVVYVLWALLPDAWIVSMGVGWYPNREWAILIPAWSIIVILLTYFTYFALALRATPGFEDMATITDSLAHFPPESTSEALSTLSSMPNAYREYALSEDATPELYDIPIGLVNRVLYSRRLRDGAPLAKNATRP
ncbi:hypothetical protein ONZ45_g8780 [Pleurotus djamor]|nr:hypothetical protein ONZ45_g8780 [Pleurotus djamor]